MTGQYAPMLVPWSVVDPEEAREEGNVGIEGYGRSRFLNQPYEAKLRVEKLDRETGEPILHEKGSLLFTGPNGMKVRTGTER